MVRRAAIHALASALIAGGLLGVMPATLAAADDPSCPDVHWIGAAGSGERNDPGANGGMGKFVYQSYLDLQGRLKKDGRTITPEAVNYPATDVPPWWDPSKWPPFVDSINQGTSAAGAQFASFAERCPNSKIVLAGYSQGAMAMHRTIYPLADHPQLAAVLLIADGDRLSGDTTINMGSLNTVTDYFGAGIGQAESDLSGANTAKLPASIGGRTISVCDTGDPVCDYNPGANVLPAGFIAVHEGYALQPQGDHAWGQRVYDLIGPPAPKPVSNTPSQTNTATGPNPPAGSAEPGAYTGT